MKGDRIRSPWGPLRRLREPLQKLLLAPQQGSPRVPGGLAGLGLASRGETVKPTRLGSASLCHQVLVPFPGTLSLTLSPQNHLQERFPLRPLIFESLHKVLSPSKGI